MQSDLIETKVEDHDSFKLYNAIQQEYVRSNDAWVVENELFFGQAEDTVQFVFNEELIYKSTTRQPKAKLGFKNTWNAKSVDVQPDAQNKLSFLDAQEKIVMTMNKLN